MTLFDEPTSLRGIAIGSALAAATLYVISFFQPYWQVTLLAPQYPDGLTVEIFLDHLTGDVREIDGLNHYIGMAPLGEAAQFERSIAGWAIGGLSVLVVAAALFRYRILTIGAALATITFPLAFMADSFYWLYTFGNNLDPRAPINLDPFTPTLLGQGKVGQFETFAGPQLGFWLAVAAAILTTVSWLLVRRARQLDDPDQPLQKERADAPEETPAAHRLAAE
jgi:hypothetical protein